MEAGGGQDASSQVHGRHHGGHAPHGHDSGDVARREDLRGDGRDDGGVGSDVATAGLKRGRALARHVGVGARCHAASSGDSVHGGPRIVVLLFGDGGEGDAEQKLAARFVQDLAILHAQDQISKADLYKTRDEMAKERGVAFDVLVEARSGATVRLRRFPQRMATARPAKLCALRRRNQLTQLRG